MCVYCTNRDEVLDPAVRSRITKSIEVSAPTVPELARMLEQYVRMYVVQELAAHRNVVSESVGADLPGALDLARMSERLFEHGFVGRDVSNYAIALAQALYANAEFQLTKELAWQVLEEQVAKKERESMHLHRSTVHSHFVPNWQRGAAASSAPPPN